MEVEVLQRALAREKAQRNRAEQLLEDKSRELYHSYEELRASHEKLEQAHAEVKEKQDQLIQSEKMASLGILSAGVAHEINNPLAFIFSNVNSFSHALDQLKKLYSLVDANLLSNANSGSPAQCEEVRAFVKSADIDFLLEDSSELVEETIEGIQRVKGIVSGLQSFARVDSGEMESVDVNLCIENTLKIANGKLQSGCVIEDKLGDIPKIKGYPGKIGQIILNLLVNAGQAVSEGGLVSVSTKRAGEYIEIKVEDNGCGMSKDVADNVFTPFFTTKPVGSGTGLGLSVTHGIVDDHGGEIAVESVVGEGTCFTVRLPISRVVPEAADAAA